MTFTRWYSSYFYSLIVFEPYSLLRKYPLNNASIIAFKTSKLIKKKKWILTIWRKRLKRYMSFFAKWEGHNLKTAKKQN